MEKSAIPFEAKPSSVFIMCVVIALTIGLVDWLFYSNFLHPFIRAARKRMPAYFPILRTGNVTSVLEVNVEPNSIVPVPGTSVALSSLDPEAGCVRVPTKVLRREDTLVNPP
jgi:hypothetical protein